MNSHAHPSELLTHIAALTALSESEASRLLDEILNYYSESLEDFVARRHRELQAEGHSNSRIFARLSEEVQRLRFPPPSLSERQIRRMIYG